MFPSNRTTLSSRVSVATALCAALLATRAIAASPKLQTIAVTPAAKAISIGQKQTFTATGTFSNGSKQVLGRAINNIAAGGDNTCALLTSRGVECWGFNQEGQLGGGNNTQRSVVPVGVIGISTATAVDVGTGSSCALLASGVVKCWGG